MLLQAEPHDHQSSFLPRSSGNAAHPNPILTGPLGKIILIHPFANPEWVPARYWAGSAIYDSVQQKSGELVSRECTPVVCPLPPSMISTAE
jgi:hypothetical protein